MTSLALLLLAAATAFWVAHVFRIPSIPLLLIAGVITSAVVPVPPDFLEDTLLLGVVVILFVAGIELNPQRVGRYRGLAIRIGMIEFFALGGAAFGVSLLMGFSIVTAAYIGLAISASSTLVVVRLLQQRQELYTPMGRTVTGVLLTQDLLVVILVPVVIGLADGWGAVGIGLASTLGLMALAGVTLRWIAPRLIPWVAEDEEFLLLTVFGVLFVFLGLANFLGVPMVVGAFLAGVTLSPFPVSALVRGQLNSLGDFFSAIFFTALGALLVLPTPAELGQALLLALLLVLLTPPIVTLISERSGFSARVGIGGGLLLAQASEFSLIVGLQGVVLGQLDERTFSLIALVTVITMVLTPLLGTGRVTGWLLRLHPFREPETPGSPPSDHVLLVGCGTSGEAILETLVGGPHEIWVVDDDPVVVTRVREAGFDVVFGDATDLEVLRNAGAHEARIVISTIRNREDCAALLALASDVPVLVRTFEAADARWVEERGGIAVSYAEAGMEDFVRWFLEEGHRIRSTG
ncbi:MAG: potassium transporter [Gemmatimonadales bacterium]|nr:MAG: potassium transporter [Gemmatimonadales bacterium]